MVKKTRMKVGVFHVELQAGLSKSRPSVVDNSKNKLLAFASVIIKFWLFHVERPYPGKIPGYPGTTLIPVPGY